VAVMQDLRQRLRARSKEVLVLVRTAALNILSPAHIQAVLELVGEVPGSSQQCLPSVFLYSIAFHYWSGTCEESLHLGSLHLIAMYACRRDITASRTETRTSAGANSSGIHSKGDSNDAERAGK
jgi:hypothetical protein